MKTLTVILLFLASVVVFAIINQYLFCPVYSFSRPSSFSGDSLYNPYSSIADKGWVKCNFHAHARCWNGITYGNTSANDIHRVYAGLHYGVAAVSNYQFIDTTRQADSNYISAYEHGCNVLKNHQLVLGAKRVCWKDYYLPQTIYNKQDVLNCLSATDSGSLYVINHPLVRGGYSASDFEKLTHYSCMEVLNPACNSSACWDAALTAGKPVFIVGDDDSHDALDSTKTAKICTWINVPQLNEKNIIYALKTGCSYAMSIGENVKRQVRLGNDDSMPRLQSVSVMQNEIEARFRLPAMEIQVIGRNGSVLSSVYNTDSVSYTMGSHDSYARITADYGNGTKLYLNPVFRYHAQPLRQAPVKINTNQTLLLSTAGMIALLVWFNIVLKILIPKRFEQIPLDFLGQNKHGNYSRHAYSKSLQLRYRRLIRRVHRLFGNVDLQRKK